MTKVCASFSLAQPSCLTSRICRRCCITAWDVYATCACFAAAATEVSHVDIKMFRQQHTRRRALLIITPSESRPCPTRHGMANSLIIFSAHHICACLRRCRCSLLFCGSQTVGNTRHCRHHFWPKPRKRQGVISKQIDHMSKCSQTMPLRHDTATTCMCCSRQRTKFTAAATSWLWQHFH